MQNLNLMIMKRQTNQNEEYLFQKEAVTVFFKHVNVAKEDLGNVLD